MEYNCANWCMYVGHASGMQLPSRGIPGMSAFNHVHVHAKFTEADHAWPGWPRQWKRKQKERDVGDMLSV